jgi:hypothetical protein
MNNILSFIVLFLISPNSLLITMHREKKSFIGIVRSAVTKQPNGQLFLQGKIYENNAWIPVQVRYNQDGTFDKTFGTMDAVKVIN